MMKIKDYLRSLKRELHMRSGKSPRTRVQLRLHRERHGSDYGGWVIKAGSVNHDSIIYSVGIGNDITFDLSVIDKYGVKVHAYDPTPEVRDWLAAQQLPSQFLYNDVALSDNDGHIKFYKPANPDYISHSSVEINNRNAYLEVPAKRLQTIMKENGHDHIDILKIDIEGAEYPVLKDILESGIKIEQILVEYHHFFDNISVADTEESVALLNKYNYRIFYISPLGYEYSLMRTEQ
ncbi:FkbM family methyltransferase [Chitinophaga rhizophila]|uniref:FkbM family methyltransferase n=1 Tax=Chitinophaga rhizophila TaxID=2866212 RepID=A0ABS7GKT0_9BACT|nr:FkbM family methyltransferase [Chitinophaga rhizophila]MBW8687344.1 FkbM family methyltransferase [Chitinophaga rhizophila]